MLLSFQVQLLLFPDAHYFTKYQLQLFQHNPTVDT
jgi:hypothetical protein